MACTFSEVLAPLTLPDADGQKVRLGSLWERQPAVLVFLRHYGCIFCREHVAQLREREQEFRVQGANLAAVGMGDAVYACRFREQTGIDFPLLIDEHRLAYRAARLRSANLLHLVWTENKKARDRARAAGHHQHELGQHPFQLGGSFVFGPGNVDRFAHESQTFGDNTTPDELLAVLRAPAAT